MNRFLLLLLTLIFSCQFTTYAQVTPASRSTVNYRLVGFSVPEQKGVTTYEFEVFEYVITDSGTTLEKQVIKQKAKKNRLIATVPKFGTTYTWKVNYYTNEKKTGSSELYRFATSYSKKTDTSLFRFRVLTKNKTYKDLLFFSDNTHALYNLEGEPIWFVPDIPGIVDEKVRLRDLKITNDGTITFLTDSAICEIDYHANVLWVIKKTDTITGDFHHEFTKLPNGHYMVCGRENITRAIPEKYIKDTLLYKNVVDVGKQGNQYFYKFPCGTLIEYDSARNVVWQWKASEHFTDDDFFKKLSITGILNPNTHMNSFYFDDKKKVIYISYRDINRISKIDYPGGNILMEYGENYTNSVKIKGHDLFYSQHHATINSDGDLMLFNNNIIAKTDGKVTENKISSVLVLEEPYNQLEDIKVKWEFSCNMDTLTSSHTLIGGSAYELSDKNILVCMGNVNRVFIASKGKTILWDALSESKNEDNTWKPIGNYRISPFHSSNNLETAIYNPTKNLSPSKF